MEDLQCPLEEDTYHNGGNDANYALRALLLLAVNSYCGLVAKKYYGLPKIAVRENCGIEDIELYEMARNTGTLEIIEDIARERRVLPLLTSNAQLSAALRDQMPFLTGRFTRQDRNLLKKIELLRMDGSETQAAEERKNQRALERKRQIKVRDPD
jgi:hypothetical protein